MFTDIQSSQNLMPVGSKNAVKIAETPTYQLSFLFCVA